MRAWPMISRPTYAVQPVRLPGKARGIGQALAQCRMRAAEEFEEVAKECLHGDSLAAVLGEEGPQPAPKLILKLPGATILPATVAPPIVVWDGTGQVGGEREALFPRDDAVCN